MGVQFARTIFLISFSCTILCYIWRVVLVRIQVPVLDASRRSPAAPARTVTGTPSPSPRRVDPLVGLYPVLGAVNHGRCRSFLDDQTCGAPWARRPWRRGFRFPCMKQEGNSVSFGTSLTLKSFYNTTASYKISLNRALPQRNRFG